MARPHWSCDYLHSVRHLKFHSYLQLARQNCGIALLPDTIAQDYIESGELVRVLPNWKAPHGILHAVYPSRRGQLPAVRVLIDYLVKQLSKY